MTKAWREWATFLRISELTVYGPMLDPAWCAMVGINPGAEELIRLLRGPVATLVRKLEPQLSGFHFLVHDRMSGVPTDEPGAFVHLRLHFKRPRRKLSLPEPFEMTRPVIMSASAPAGVDLDIIVDRDPDTVQAMIDEQSALVLRLLEMHIPDAPVERVARQTKQFLHYFANMLQMKVS